MSGGEPDELELPLEDGYEDALAQLATRGMEGPSDFAPVRGKFGAVDALTLSFASLLRADQARWCTRGRSCVSVELFLPGPRLWGWRFG